jgi:hypothetical protein
MLGEAVALHLGQVETSPTHGERERERAPLVLVASGPVPYQEREIYTDAECEVSETHEKPNRATTGCVCEQLAAMDGWMDGRMVLLRI